MIISSSFSYLFRHWGCFNVSLFRQCSIVVLRCSALFPLFRGCSVVPVVFRYSGVVPSFSGCSLFWCSGGVPLFRRSAGVPCSVVPCSGVPGFIVCRFKITLLEIKQVRSKKKLFLHFFVEIMFAFLLHLLMKNLNGKTAVSR